MIAPADFMLLRLRGSYMRLGQMLSYVDCVYVVYYVDEKMTAWA